ncbi:chromosomal replication initiator protein DnaA [candidate division WOR-3 bacterium]|nr:chromosomal replication initiator protein DnaA [candidate division WOR-3 bacterium]
MLNGAKNLWEEVLGQIKPKIPSQNYETWLEPTEGETLTQNTLWVRVPNAFFIDWIEEHYHTSIYEILGTLNQEHLKVKYKSVEGGKEKSVPSRVYQPDSSHLQPRYTFDNFIIGESNNFARAASLAVAKTPGRQYNPLFIYGSVGLGKTHLLQAVGNYIKEHFSGLKVYYLGCEEFMTEMIDAIQINRVVQFKNKYRRKDALLIDDIQFLEGKEGLQEEIFHTFNALYDEGKQVIFSSDRPPGALANLEERLVSRFQGGLVCDIKPPSFETRIAILKRKASLAEVQVSDEVISFIATEIRGNIRELEGALIKLFAFASLTNGVIDIERARELLRDLLSRNGREVTMGKIQQVVANHYNISLASMRGKRRMQSIVLPRDVAIYLSREYTTSSLKEIGKTFGGRDHTTIIHAYNKIKKLLNRNNELSEEVNNIVKLITCS